MFHRHTYKPHGHRFARGDHGHDDRELGHHRHGRGGGRSGLGRFFAHGDLRLVILQLIAEKPRHGYEIIKAIEEQVGGAYSPSPGVVYPTLTLLEELGHVTVSHRRRCEEAAHDHARGSGLSRSLPPRAGRAARAHGRGQPRVWRRSSGADHARDGEPEARAAPAPRAGTAGGSAGQRRGRGARRRCHQHRADLTDAATAGPETDRAGARNDAGIAAGGVPEVRQQPAARCVFNRRRKPMTAQCVTEAVAQTPCGLNSSCPERPRPRCGARVLDGVAGVPPCGHAAASRP